MHDLLVMFLEFMKTGLFAVGGGMATIPFLYEMARNYTWFSEGSVADMIAISESTPGPIGVNMATYVGFNAYGIAGAVTTTIGLVLPSVIIMFIISNFLSKFGESKIVKNAFYGIRPAVAAMILLAATEIFKVTLFTSIDFSAVSAFFACINYKAVVLLAVLLIAMKIKNFHPIVYIGAAAAVGIAIGL